MFVANLSSSLPMQVSWLGIVGFQSRADVMLQLLWCRHACLPGVVVSGRRGQH